MGQSLDLHDPSSRETSSSHPAHNHIPSLPCCPGTMGLLLGDPQAQPAGSKPWDKRKVLETLPSPQLSSENSQHQRVNVLGCPGSGPFPPHLIPTPKRGCVGLSQCEWSQAWAGRCWEVAAGSQAFPGRRGLLLGAERPLILGVTPQGGCGRQVKSCREKYWQEGEPRAQYRQLPHLPSSLMLCLRATQARSSL